MAKQKTRECPMSTTATQPYPGCWLFATGRYEWEYHPDRMGLNLEVRRRGDITYEPAIYAKNLDQAVMFAHGFEGGYQAAKVHAAKEAEEKADSEAAAHAEHIEQLSAGRG